MSRKKSVTISRKPTPKQEPAVTADGAISPGNSQVSVEVMKTQARDAPACASSVVGCGLLVMTAYSVVYFLSFGAVFGALMLGAMVPGSAVLARAMNEGTNAAKRAFKHFEGHEERSAQEEPGHAAEGPATA